MKKLKDIGAVDDSLSETSWKNKKTFLQYLEQNVCVSEDVYVTLGSTMCARLREQEALLLVSRRPTAAKSIGATYATRGFWGARGGASLKSHQTKTVANGGCTGAPPLDGSGITSRKVKEFKRKELEDLQPKVRINPSNWAGVTDDDEAKADADGLLELLNDYETKYLGRMMRTDADTMHEVRQRVRSAMRVFWDLRRVRSDSYMAREDKLRLYKAAVVSSCVYGCESWMITPEVGGSTPPLHEREMPSSCVRDDSRGLHPPAAEHGCNQDCS